MPFDTALLDFQFEAFLIRRISAPTRVLSPQVLIRSSDAQWRERKIRTFAAFCSPNSEWPAICRTGQRTFLCSLSRSAERYSDHSASVLLALLLVLLSVQQRKAVHKHTETFPMAIAKTDKSSSIFHHFRTVLFGSLNFKQNTSRERERERTFKKLKRELADVRTASIGMWVRSASSFPIFGFEFQKHVYVFIGPIYFRLFLLTEPHLVWHATAGEDAYSCGRFLVVPLIEKLRSRRRELHKFYSKRIIHRIVTIQWYFLRRHCVSMTNIRSKTVAFAPELCFSSPGSTSDSVQVNTN